jgi:hypothetical protein
LVIVIAGLTLIPGIVCPSTTLTLNFILIDLLSQRGLFAQLLSDGGILHGHGSINLAMVGGDVGLRKVHSCGVLPALKRIAQQRVLYY